LKRNIPSGGKKKKEARYDHFAQETKKRGKKKKKVSY